MFVHAAPQYSVVVVVVVWIIIEFSLWTSSRLQPQSLLLWLQYTNVCSHFVPFAKQRSISLFQTIFSSLALCIWYNLAFIDTITLRKGNWKKNESIRWFVAICHYSKLKYEKSIVVVVVVLPRLSWNVMRCFLNQSQQRLPLKIIVVWKNWLAIQWTGWKLCSTDSRGEWMDE